MFLVFMVGKWVIVREAMKLTLKPVKNFSKLCLLIDYEHEFQKGQKWSRL